MSFFLRWGVYTMIASSRTLVAKQDLKSKYKAKIDSFL